MAIEDLYRVEQIRHMPFFYYPTVNRDTDPVTAAQRAAFARELATRPGAGRKAILYLHVPFCRTHCSFCFYNVNVVRKDPSATRPYLDAVLRELRHLGAMRYVRELSIEHVFIGGGTPSMLPDEQLRTLLAGLATELDLSGVEDFSIEMNLETTTRSNLEICRGGGVTRVSFGWQTSIPRLRKFLALVPSEETLASVRAELERLGYPLIWDVMYALPGQTSEDWQHDLQRSIDAGVACVDVHRTDLVPPAPLYELVRSGKLAVPDARDALAQYLQAYRTLTGAGYVVNTFQQFNRPDVPSAVSHYGRHYYRSSHDIVAVGPGAIGVLADSAYMNERDVGTYARATETGLPVGCLCRLDDATWQERDFVLGLGQLWSVPKRLLRLPLSSQQERALEVLIAHGAIEERADEFRLTEAAVGYHFSIAGEFVTEAQVGRNVGYLRAMPKEIAWSPTRRAAARGARGAP